jgi:transposase InsO family protein
MEGHAGIHHRNPFEPQPERSFLTSGAESPVQRWNAQALGVKVGTILTDNGREFCGIQERHPYELLLAMEEIEHRTTKIRSPRTNGFVERMSRTLLDGCFRVQGRQTWYIGPDEIQRDLDRFLRYYNLERSHQGYRLKGRTPAQALMEALSVSEIPDIIPAEEVNEPLSTAA